MEGQKFRTGKESLRTIAGVCGMAGIITAVIVYSKVTDEATRQLCGAAALISAVITIRQFMYNPVKPKKNHEHN